MFGVEIKITGPGLVVNTPVAVIVNALQNAGYNVNLPEFAGQFQYVSKDGYPSNELNELDSDILQGSKININVQPMPWGG